MKIPNRILNRFIVPAFAVAAQVVGGFTGGAAMANPQQEIGFIEQYALSSDREKELEQLVPGTDDYYFFRCLEYLNTGQFDRVDDLLKQWTNRHGENSRFQIIRNRLALLGYDTDPDKTLDYLKRELDINLTHEREIPQTQRDLPQSLDQALIDPDKLLRDALRRNRNLSQVEDSILEKLASVNLSKEQLVALLQRIQHPDFPDLVKLITRELKSRDTTDFGRFTVHRILTLEQMKECAAAVPALKDDNGFVNSNLARLAPSEDVNWQADKTEHRAYLERLRAYVTPLKPKFNSLKACVLFRILELDRSEEKYDEDLFLEYLKLPRRVSYISPEFLETIRRPEHIAQLGKSFHQQTLLFPVGDDTELVSGFLQHFLANATSDRKYRPYIQTDFLSRQMAIAKIVRGLGDVEKLASVLSPQEYQALLNRVDLDFARTNREFYQVNEDVEIELYTKNINSLIVKVFEINTGNFYRAQQREIDTDINLDGLVPNQEMHFDYTDAPALRVKRKFDIPGITERGVYIVDFIAGGKSSRALIRKGRLSLIEQTTVAGHILRVVDDANEIVKDANLWIDGRRYNPTDEGLIAVPFTDSPRHQMAIISSGDFSCYEGFQHKSENYSLSAALMLDRESLLRSNEAQIFIRPMLQVAGLPVGTKLLKDVTLTITSTDHDGHPSTKSFKDLELTSSAATVCKFVVPPRLNVVNAVLTAKVENVSAARTDDLSVSRNWTINEIDKTDQIQDAHLIPHAGGYSLEVLGKSGELRAKQAVRVKLKIAGIKRPLSVDLQSGPDGMIELGELNNVEFIDVLVAGGSDRQWPIDRNRQTIEQSIHALAGQQIEIPAPEYVNAEREDVSLFEIRRDTVVEDRFANISIADGLLSISDLAAGDYRLRLKSLNKVVTIRVTDGQPVGSTLRGRYRNLEVRSGQPVHFTSVVAEEDDIEVKVGNVNDWTRVHVLATRYQPRFDAFKQLAPIRDVTPAYQKTAVRRSVYLAGRSIGDEYQYILDRKKKKKYPGNMLDRPSLLVSPWAVRDTANNQEVLQQGNDYGIVGNDAQGLDERDAAGEKAAAQTSDFSNLDFLKDATLIAVNVRPDENGIIRIPRNELGDRQHVQVVLTDSFSTSVRTLNLPLKAKTIRDLRMKTAMDADGHFSRVKQVDVLAESDEFKIEDILSSEFQYFDDLNGVWRLLSSLSGDSAGEFRFVLDWPELDEEERLELYDEHACHELNFFLKQKDARFFDAVVAKHIANKRDKTFMDHYLLGHDLSSFLDPWNYQRLNTVERILLAQRTEDQTANIARNIEELYLLSPTPRATFSSYFDVSLGFSLMDENGDGKFSAQQNMLLQEKLSEAGPAEMPELAYIQPPVASAAPSRGISPGNSSSGGEGIYLSDSEDVAGGPISGGARFFGGRGGGGGGLGGAGMSRDGVVEGGAGEARFAKPYSDPAPSMRFETRTRTRQDGTVEPYTVPVPYTEIMSQLYDMRSASEALYRPIGVTKEWIENNYWHLTPEQTNSDRVGPNRFWRDYANHREGPFISPHFAEANRNLTEIMFAMAVTDLPFKGDDHEFEYADATMSLMPKGPMVVLHQQVRPTVFNPENTTILVSENFFQKNDRYRYEDGLKFDKFVSGDFYAHTLYGGQVVITNPTSTPRPIELLLQIPKGAVVASGTKETQSLPQDLAAFSTQTYEYFFYFPTEGQFSHFPAHVSSEEKVLAVAAPVEINVVDHPVEVDETSWEFVSQNGTDDDVIKYINDNNVQRLNLEKIAFRMKDKAFFSRALDALRSRFVYHDKLWAYSVLHNDTDLLKEYLRNADTITSRLGMAFDSTLVSINPVERDWYYHKEYSPLINARIHEVGQKRKILNPQFHQQYHQLLNVLSNRELTQDDHLTITYYMLLQDRVEEAIEHFEMADGSEHELQYAYCSAYLDFYLEKPGSAVATARKWEDYPVLHWQNRFKNVIAQAKEIETGIAETIDSEDVSQRQTELASKAGSFEFEISEGKIKVDYQNLENATLNFYEMDIELLFSRSPFSQDQQGSFSLIRPNMTQEVKLPEPEGDTPAGVHEIDIPSEFSNKNVLVEIVSGDQSRSKSYFENSLSVQLIEKFGQLRITEDATGNAVPKAYVKVYAKDTAGNVRFHKDGYTDLRGRFDYVSQSNNSVDNVMSYSILIMDPERGAIIRQAAIPSR